jgi:hypothetical protein
MKRVAHVALIALLLSLIFTSGHTPLQAQTSVAPSAYLGFDRNDYPGDENLQQLHRTFSYAGFWLNQPPGEKINTWAGKRRVLQSSGFGFLVLFNGRLFPALKTVANARSLGKSDADSAAVSARREGFPAGTIIFLDQEEGGRMLPEQKAYIYAWVDEIAATGFRAGIYCSGIAAQEEKNVSVITAKDIRENSAGRKIVYWVANDACPPSPGCTFPGRAPVPDASGVDFADVWQFAQSPMRADFAAGCKATYDRDGSCYPPGIDPSQRLHLDLNTASSADPSHGRIP